MRAEQNLVTTGPSGIARFIPLLGWLPHYQRAWLRPDIIAGLTIWALVVPQGIAYRVGRPSRGTGTRHG
jgi:hypothetical protein